MKLVWEADKGEGSELARGQDGGGFDRDKRRGAGGARLGETGPSEKRPGAAAPAPEI